jgi:hypothetical protein
MARALGNPFRGNESADASSRGGARGALLVSRLLSPQIGFPLLWLLGVALAQIRLFGFQQHGDWSLRAWGVMLLVPVAFLCGTAVGRAGADLVGAKVRRSPEPSRREWRQASLALLAIGLLECAHQFLVAGGIPLFQDDIDRSRFALPGGPSVVLTNCAPLAAAVALAAPHRLDPRQCRVEFAVAATGLLAVGLLGGRGQVILGIGVIVLVRALRFGAPSLRLLGGALAVLVLFLAVIFFVRTRQNVGQPFEYELYSSVLPDMPAPLRVLVPLHVAIASNFEALARVVDFIPDQLAYGGGAYNAIGFDLVIPGSKHVSEVSERLTGPFVTTTVAGPLWADGGFTWVASGLAAIGTLVGGAHRLATRTGKLRYILPAAYLTYLCFFGIYQSLFTQHPDWVVITPLLFATGAWLDGWRPRATLRRVAPYGVADARRKLSAAMPRRRRSVIAAVGAVLAVIVTATVIGGTLGDDPETRDAEALGVTPAGTVPAPAGQIVTNGDGLLDNEPLWAVRRRSRTVTLTRYSLVEGKRWHRGSEVRFPARVRPGTRFDVGSWAGETRALFALSASRQAVKVEVFGANRRRLLSVGDAEEPSLFDRGTRDVAIATYSGFLADLFIVDRGVADERARLAVYSGESAFRTRILRVRLPVLGLSPRDWTLDVGGVAPGRPDLILFTRRGASGEPEVHILSGATEYRSFRLHSRAALATPGRAPDASVDAVTVWGAPAAAVIDDSKGVPSRVTLLRLGPRPGG